MIITKAKDVRTKRIQSQYRRGQQLGNVSTLMTTSTTSEKFSNKENSTDYNNCLKPSKPLALSWTVHAHCKIKIRRSFDVSTFLKPTKIQMNWRTCRSLTKNLKLPLAIQAQIFPHFQGFGILSNYFNTCFLQTWQRINHCLTIWTTNTQIRLDNKMWILPELFHQGSLPT